RESLYRAGVEGKDVGHVVFGHVVNTEPKDMYLSRVAAINGGCVEGTPAFNVNRLCGSGLQAIVSASQAIMLGDCDIAIGGGADIIPGTKKVAGPGASITMPIGNKDDRWEFDDMDSAEITIGDAPRANEMVIAIVYSIGGRPHARVTKVK
ncbi:MAG: hypothetical protein EBU96_04695, partial [Actinobacteria bacterium]|nr:hypothetical protein [Actinomycetota bacterium]